MYFRMHNGAIRFFWHEFAMVELETYLSILSTYMIPITVIAKCLKIFNVFILTTSPEVANTDKELSHKSSAGEIWKRVCMSVNMFVTSLSTV